jgi:hypothetical protein
MILLRRVADRALPWLAVIAALACCDVVAWWPGGRPQPDASMSLPELSAETRGPSVYEAIERLSRKGPEWVSPPDVVE